MIAFGGASPSVSVSGTVRTSLHQVCRVRPRHKCINSLTGTRDLYAPSFALCRKSRMVAIPAAAVVAQDAVKTCDIKVEDLTPEAFAPFGQVCGPQEDGKEYDEADAQLVLDKGTPRFYIMNLPGKGLQFSHITFHSKVTQCLGSAGTQPWYMGVAAPTLSLDAYPSIEDLRAFRIPAGHFVKLHVGTWHAGPLFEGPAMAFFNLELSDTNIVDHFTHHYSQQGLRFELVE